ncbi:hypothetical protein GCM10027599_20050 [Yimella radicis]
MSLGESEPAAVVDGAVDGEDPPEPEGEDSPVPGGPEVQLASRSAATMTVPAVRLFIAPTCDRA